MHWLELGRSLPGIRSMPPDMLKADPVPPPPPTPPSPPKPPEPTERRPKPKK